MKFANIAAAALSAAPALAAPSIDKRQANLDITVLQFALTLEHLENNFYQHGLRRIARSAFFAAGYDQMYYDNLRRISDDETDHVNLLSAALTGLGQQPVKECNYTFEAIGAYNDVKSFVGLSSVLEGVGTSAYLYGARLITSKDYLNVAGSILVTEALHTSLQRNAVKEVPFATPYGTPLDPTSVYTLAAAFINNCPSSNTGKVPFTPYPALSVTMSSSQPAMAGATIQLWTNKGTTIPSGTYATIISGLDIISVTTTIGNAGQSASIVIPADNTAGLTNAIAGQTYILLTSGKANGTVASAGNIIAGPAIVEIVPAAPKFLS